VKEKSLCGIFCFFSLLLIFASGCSGRSSSQQSERLSSKKQEVTQPTVEPSPYQRLELSRKQSRELDRLFPEKHRRILEEAAELEMFSIGGTAGQKAEEEFRYFGVVGKMRVTDGRIKAELVSALFDGVATPSNMMGCFKPHHGVRATHEGKTVDLLICFECQNFKGFAESGEFGGAISKLPEDLFNRILTSGGVPLSAR
jgi:hypothetical protein